MALSKITNASLATGIDSAKIGAGDVSNTEHAFLNSISSNVQTQIAGAGASAYSGYASRNQNTASGTQAITGVGFTPKIVYFLCVMGGTNRLSWGFGTSSDNRCVLDYHSANPTSSYDTYSSSGDALKPMVDNSNHQKGSINSMDADGFTITWTKVGSPASATMEIHFFAIG